MKFSANENMKFDKNFPHKKFFNQWVLLQQHDDDDEAVVDDKMLPVLGR